MEAYVSLTILTHIVLFLSVLHPAEPSLKKTKKKKNSIGLPYSVAKTLYMCHFDNLDGLKPFWFNSKAVVAVVILVALVVST